VQARRKSRDVLIDRLSSRRFWDLQIQREEHQLRVLILYANPVAVSFGATLHRQIVTTLTSHGHNIDDCDLYAESFNPVMSEDER
jgi:hypothetical protein